jgi:prepilin-type N-terminal cleavage/methylation domain-containing protein
MTTMRPGRDARGMTLVEMLIALVVFSIVLASALTFLGRQGTAFRLGSERMDVLQNLRFAATTLSNDLRTAGSNVPDQQPQLVYAGASVLAFNGDYATNVASDAWAVYHDADAPTGAVTALRSAQKITLPGTTFQYPNVDYTYQAANSPAELLIFYFTPDATTARTDDYILYRQVNNQAPAMVARDLLQTPGVPFFQYYRLRTPNNAPAFIALVPNGELPLTHSVNFHMSPADTGPASRIDSLRGVQISFTATNGLTGARERRGALTRLVRFPNAGFATSRSSAPRWAPRPSCWPRETRPSGSRGTRRSTRSEASGTSCATCCGGGSWAKSGGAIRTAAFRPAARTTRGMTKAW